MPRCRIPTLQVTALLVKRATPAGRHRLPGALPGCAHGADSQRAASTDSGDGPHKGEWQLRGYRLLPPFDLAGPDLGRWRGRR